MVGWMQWEKPPEGEKMLSCSEFVTTAAANKNAAYHVDHRDKMMKAGKDDAEAANPAVVEQRVINVNAYQPR